MTTPGRTAEGWHSIAAAFDCLKRYQFQEVRKIYEPGVQTSSPLAMGLCFHAGRAAWFSSKFALDLETWSAVQEAIKAEARHQRLPVSADDERKALLYMQEYMRYWSQLPLPTPIVTEYDIGPSPLQEAMAARGLTRTNRLDDVSIYPEGGWGKWIGEAKTTSQSIEGCLNEYTLHGQPMHQLALWKAAPQGEAMHGKVDGVMLDITQKTYDKNKPARFARIALPISDYSLSWFVEELTERLQIARQIDWNARPSRNIAACTKSIGRARVACPYRDLCRFGAAARGRFVDESGTNLVAWRPSAGKEVPPWE